jgi:hypothetical protein
MVPVVRCKLADRVIGACSVELAAEIAAVAASVARWVLAMIPCPSHSEILLEVRPQGGKQRQLVKGLARRFSIDLTLPIVQKCLHR